MARPSRTRLIVVARRADKADRSRISGGGEGDRHRTRPQTKS